MYDSNSLSPPYFFFPAGCSCAVGAGCLVSLMVLQFPLKQAVGSTSSLQVQMSPSTMHPDFRMSLSEMCMSPFSVPSSMAEAEVTFPVTFPWGPSTTVLWHVMSPSMVPSMRRLPSTSTVPFRMVPTAMVVSFKGWDVGLRYSSLFFFLLNIVWMMFDVCCVPWIFCKSRQKKQIGKEGDGDFLEDRMDGGSPPSGGGLQVAALISRLTVADGADGKAVCVVGAMNGIGAVFKIPLSFINSEYQATGAGIFIIRNGTMKSGCCYICY